MQILSKSPMLSRALAVGSFVVAAGIAGLNIEYTAQGILNAQPPGLTQQQQTKIKLTGYMIGAGFTLLESALTALLIGSYSWIRVDSDMQRFIKKTGTLSNAGKWIAIGGSGIALSVFAWVAFSAYRADLETSLRGIGGTHSTDEVLQTAAFCLVFLPELLTIGGAYFWRTALDTEAAELEGYATQFEDVVKQRIRMQNARPKAKP